MQLIPELLSDAAAIARIRRDLHARPELSFQETRTADLVAASLSGWGIPVIRGLGGTGVVGVVKSGISDRAVGLRADLDALPMQEGNNFSHASIFPGRMHGCGHDGHTAMLLAAAKYLSANRNFDGTVYLIFQPAEEFGGGGRRMIDDGLFERCPMEAVFGMHNWPGLPYGQFAIAPGAVMASSNEFSICIRGSGSHAALPHNSVDPILIGCELVQAFQTILTRNKKPLDSAVISVSMIHAGEATNIIPETCELRGTVRTFSLDVLELIERRMRQLSERISLAYDATCDFDFFRSYPPTINSTAEAMFAREVIQSIVGESNVCAQEPTMGAEDFAFMLQAKPGAYCFIGNGDGAHRQVGHGEGPCLLHNPAYDFNDDLIPLGGTYWVKLVEAWFGLRHLRG